MTLESCKESNRLPLNEDRMSLSRLKETNQQNSTEITEMVIAKDAGTNGEFNASLTYFPQVENTIF